MVSISIDSHNFSPSPFRHGSSRWPIACPCLNRAVTNPEVDNPFPEHPAAKKNGWM
jgi:hypothetical protein